MGINQNLLNKITFKQRRTDFSKFGVGDTIKVFIKIKEEKRERIQMFEGIVIRISGEGNSKTFIVRKESFGVWVEKIFLLNSPIISKIEIAKKGKVHQSRIYYMRDRKGKSSRIKQKNS